MALRSCLHARTRAIECFLLVAFLAYNVFHAFLVWNVKPAARKGKTQIFWGSTHRRRAL